MSDYLYFSRYWTICVLQLFVNLGCDDIKFEINFIFLIKPFWYITKKSRQKLKYLENGKSLSGEIKKPFSCQKLSQTWECAFKQISYMILLPLLLTSNIFFNWVVGKSMFKVNNKDVRTTLRNVFLGSFLLTYRYFSSESNLDVFLKA